MSTFIDISLPLDGQLPVWPGSPGFQLDWLARLGQGGEVNNSRLQMDVHVGTHVDAPLHFLENGAPVSDLALDTLIGPAVVVDARGHSAITVATLEEMAIPSDVRRILFRTDNSQEWAGSSRSFKPSYVALTEEGAEWIVARGIRLVGIDYLSIQRFGDGPATHQTLLRNDVIIVEGLDLHHVEPGEYQLIVLPLRIMDAEGAPARAVLQPLHQRST